MLDRLSPKTSVLLLLVAVLNYSALIAAQPLSPPAQPAEHVVLVVWDGMRPDFITPKLTPNLWNLRTNGVFFRNNHSVYVSSTEVNGTALATGMYPEHSGIIANSMYFPQINLLEAAATESVDTIRRSDALTGGNYLRAQTMAETLHAAGFSTFVAGTKDVCLLHDRSNVRNSPAASNSPVLHNGRVLPRSRQTALKKELGKDYPVSAIPNVGRDEWTTKGLIDEFWKGGVPRFSLLWLSEPDASQHANGPGSTNALAGIASSDRDLGLVLAALEKKGLRNRTDVFVVSDHAFSTIERGPDVCDLLKKAGFAATRKFQDPEPGEILVVGLGGTVMLYVVDHDPELVQRVVEFFQQSDFAGVIFARQEVTGAFTLAQSKIDCGANAPDVVVSLRWSAATNDVGAAGLLATDNGKKGAGSHGSLSYYDLHNTLVGCGPHLRRGFVDELPSGNVDVAPTILWLLGVSPSKPQDGRVLREALVDCQPATESPKVELLKAETDIHHKHWSQYLRVLSYDGVSYFDEGNTGKPAR